MTRCLPFRHRWVELTDVDWTTGNSVIREFRRCTACGEERNRWRFRPVQRVNRGYMTPVGYGVVMRDERRCCTVVAWWGLNWIMAFARWFYYCVAFPRAMITKAELQREVGRLREQNRILREQQVDRLNIPRFPGRYP